MLNSGINEYASKLAIDFDFTFEQHLKNAQEDFEKLLHNGLQTEKHLCYFLKNDKHEKLGYLWIQIRERFGQKKMFIDDIFVFKECRGKGYGRYMLEWLETKTKEIGLTEIGLNVRADNLTAHKLYQSMGYASTNMSMKKNLNAK